MNWLKKFMVGRYGMDQLSIAIMVLCLLFLVLGQLLNLQIFATLAFVILIVSYARALSRNINKRYQENYKFLKWWNPINQKLKRFTKQLADRKTHHHFKCPNCKQTLRVPRGKGKVKITCPKCKTVMIKKA